MNAELVPQKRVNASFLGLEEGAEAFEWELW